MVKVIKLVLYSTVFSKQYSNIPCIFMLGSHVTLQSTVQCSVTSKEMCNGYGEKLLLNLYKKKSKKKSIKLVIFFFREMLV